MLSAMTLHTSNRHDINDHPAGGWVVSVIDESTVEDHVEFAEFDATRRTAPSIYVRWQDGPLGPRPNGAFVEDVINAALQRLQWFQQPGGGMLEGEFACLENAAAIEHLQAALDQLYSRSERSTMAQTEGQ